MAAARLSLTTAMVAGQFTEGKIALYEEMLLDASMAESMQRELGGIQAHVGEPCAKPQIEFVPKEDLEAAYTVRHLEDGRVTTAVVFAVDLSEPADSPDWTQQWIFGRRQWDLMNPLAKLVVLGFGHLEHDPV